MNINLRKIFYVLMLLVLVFFFTSCVEDLNASLDDTIEKSFAVNEGGKLEVDTDVGSIKVRAKKGAGVEVKIFLKARSVSESRAREMFEHFDVDFRKSGNDVFVTADYDQDKVRSIFGRRGRLNASFVITVPAKYDLGLKTKGGNIELSDIEGDVKIKTSGGNLEMAYVKGTLQGKTSGGNITLDGCSGDVDVRTSGGNIKIGKVDGMVKAHTSGGNIKVKEVMGTIKADTSGGSVSAYISRQPRAGCSLTTSGGAITVYLDEDIAVDIDARTSGGRVSTDFPVTVKGKTSRSKLKTQLNGGGPELYLDTSGGSIHIKKID